MNYTWNLSVLYNGFDDPEFSSDIKKLGENIGEFVAFAKNAEELSHAEMLEKYIAFNEEITLIANKLIIFANLRYSANTKDTEAASNLGKLMGMLSAIAAPSAKISKLIAGYDDLEQIISSSEKLSEHKYMLLNIKRDSKYLLEDGEEAVFAKMNISGANAWSDLQSVLTSSVTVDYDGKKIPLSSARNLAYDKDGDVRKKAYEAELLCYESIKDSVAFALNSIKQQVLSECELRGYQSPLQKTLYTSRMKKETLDALISEV